MNEPVSTDEDGDKAVRPNSALAQWLRRNAASAEFRASFLRYATIVWLLALVVLGAWVIFKGRDDLVATWEEIKTAKPGWIVFAVLVQCLMLVFSGLTYRWILRRLGYQLGLLGLISAHMQRTTISTVTPGGGPASVFMFVRYLQQRDVPFEDGFLTIAVRSIGVTVTFIFVLIPGALIGRSWPGAIIAIALTAALIIAAIALWKGEKDDWQTPLRWSERLPEWLGSRIRSFIQRFRDHGLEPADLLPSIVYNLLVRLTIVGVLYACLRALGANPAMETLLNTYFASILASTVIPVFGGAGAVEAVAVLTLQQAGIDSGVAIGATLLWRLIDLWIPVGIGLILHAGHELPGLTSGKRTIANTYEGRLDEPE